MSDSLGLMGRPKWQLLEALAWIAFRNEQAIADTFGPGAYWADLLGHPVTDGQNLHAVTDSRLDLLLSALQLTSLNAAEPEAGAVLERAVEKRTILPIDAPGNNSALGLARLLQSMFWREDLIQVWPPNSARDSLGASAGGEAWRVRPSEQQKSWVVRTEAVTEAERRRNSQTEAALCRALAKMAGECHFSWTAASIAVARRKDRGARTSP